jgi:hypothetical protein
MAARALALISKRKSLVISTLLSNGFSCCAGRNARKATVAPCARVAFGAAVAAGTMALHSMAATIGITMMMSWNRS